MTGSNWLVMKLLNKGRLLITIPIVVQFIFVLLVLLSYRKAEEEALKGIHFREQTQELTTLSTLMYRCIGVLSVCGMSNQAKDLKEFDSVYQQLQRKVELLTLLDQENPTELSQRAKKNFTRMMGDLYSARQMIEVRGPLNSNTSSLILLVSELKHEIGESLIIIEDLVAMRVKEGQSDLQQIERSRTLIIGSIVTGFAVNMLICAFLLLRYSRDFARRFNIVIDNTNRIAQGLPLHEKVDGSDELTDLDVVFHDMDLALKESQARKEQLMNMVSHDLRGPLTSVQISFELLLNKEIFQLPEKATKRLNDTDKMIKRLSRLVNDVLDFDKLKVGKLDLTLDMVPLRSILEECVTELQPILEKENIEVVIPDTDIVVIADRERVPQILLNLLSNALKFNPKNGQIVIEATVVKDDSKNSELAKISIRDQGPGVPELYRDTIFLPFEQVPDNKRPKKGSTGLGLPICKMLVDLHGGDIGVEVPESGGSIFWFTLPIAETDEL